MKSRLPDSTEILPELASEPVQTETGVEPFEVVKKGITYTVEPKFEYEINGLIVTYHESGSFIDITHKDWGDEINIKDICVLWGGNTTDDIFRNMKFASGNFTCMWRTKDERAWRSFSNSQISNNHLISSDPAVAKQIMKANIGDQVRIRGYLSTYSHGGGFKRGTSTTRDDTGDGACETIFVNEFDILKSKNRGWPAAMNAASICALGIAVFSLARLLFTANSISNQ